MNIENLVQKCQSIKSRTLGDWLKRFLTATPEALARWKGAFTEVMLAKAMSILRKRGVKEVQLYDTALFDKMIQAVQRCPEHGAEKQGSGEEDLW
jgi:hypothetical protein